ncbi:hypothetical protein OJ967_15020 [Peribacillus frigoritolerans]|uniref:hypothetical protein n=1 Tax=Peribacillus frigoritolerans TaxID=450367 RepID=UPI0022266AB9|nr:hypothetical protein [Peribacillus frigoritolerans]UYZ01798.1 hypothetical protein OJ967_15020 [Peribacillus frigoritolerans]
MIHHRTSEQNRIHKILQDANIKLTSVLSDIFVVSGRRILEAILNGEKIETDVFEKWWIGEQKQVLLTLPMQLMGVFAVIIAICCGTIGSIWVI